MEEVSNTIKIMRRENAAGVDDIRAEQTKQFSPVVVKWLITLFNVW